MVSSGLRIGTPALATRGFVPAEFAEVADMIATELTHQPSEKLTAELRTRVTSLATKFPLYSGL
jgi:glycine hydroxymethyltransferase